MLLPPHSSGRRSWRTIRIIIETVGFISSLLTIGTILATSFLTLAALLAHQQWLLIPSLFFALGVLLTIAILAVSNLIFARTIPGRWIVRGYRWVNAEYTYCIENEDLTEHWQEIKIILRATRSGVNIFENKYSPSGHPFLETLEVLSPGHQLMKSDLTQRPYFPFNRWKYYYIYMGYELPLDSDVEVKIKQTLHYKPDGSFEPFIAKTVTEPIKGLKLRLLVPQSVHLHNAYKCELNHAGPHNQIIDRISCPYPYSIIQYNGKFFKDISYELSKPRLNHRYEIRWEW